tara:strand:- start:23 stop:505 length:483 start_codon:yes stop_codon:yes gene_type:complete
MAYSSNIAKTKRDGKVTLVDGAAATYIADFNVGDFTWESSNPALVVIRSRSSIVGARDGDDPEISFSFTCHLRALTSATADALLDFIGGNMAGSALTSTGGNGYEPFLCTIKFLIDAKSIGDSVDYLATFSKCQLTATMTEGEPSSIAISGVCLGGVAYT